MNNLTLPLAAQPTAHLERYRYRVAPPGVSVKTLVAATAVALLLLPGVRNARAQIIGDIDVRSQLGERFFAAVPVQSDAVLDPNCIRVGPNPAAPEGADRLSGARVRINPTGAVESVIIETAGVVTSPIVGVRVEVGCTNPVVRDFVVLGESVPLSVASAVPSAAPVTAAPTTTRAQPPRAGARAPTARVAPPAQGAAIPAPRVAPPAPRVQSAAPGADLVPKAPVVSSHSIAPPAVAAAVTPAPAKPTVVADQDAQRRITELRARSDDHAANLLALEDRLTLLQKQAELLKAQLEQTLAPQTTASQPSPAAAIASNQPAAAASTATVATVSTAASAATADVVAAASARKSRSIGDLLTDWRVLGGGLGALLFAAIAYKLGRRKPAEPERFGAARTDIPAWQRSSTQATQPASQRPDEHERTQEFRATPAIADAERTVEWGKSSQPKFADETTQWDARPPTTTTMPVPESAHQDAATATNPGVGITREFHITQQFQPTTERTVAISTPEEIVQQARTHYMDDGDTFRAIDLLEMAVSVRTDSTRPWQALFAIYRRENMPERFQRLALAYRQAFGEDSNWPAIQGLGLAMDASNPLYSVTVAGAEPVPEDLLERWLGVPLDFTAHLLANEMHDQLMETFPGRAKKRKRVAGE